MVGISFLLESDDEARNHYLTFSKDLLSYFVKKSKDFYSEKFIVYNVHSLLHIADDREHFKTSLNKISAFPFENYLHSIKKLVKNAKKTYSSSSQENTRKKQCISHYSETQINLQCHFN